MARRGQHGDPTDWVTRAADDAIRHAGGTDRVITCSSGASPSGPVHLGNLREFLTVHFVADELQRRGAARAAPARLGRLRPVPQGAGGRRPVLGRPHRPAALGGPGPVGVPRVLGRALQGAAARRAARAGRGHGGDLPDRALHVGGLPRAGAARRTPPRRHRRGAREVPHQAAGARSPSRRPRSSPTRWPTTRTSTPTPAPGWSGSRSSRTAASAGATPRTSRRTTTRRPTSRTPASRAGSPASPTWPPRTRASWSGRSTGRCAGRSSTSTSSRPAWTTRRPARRSPSATSWSRTIFDMPRPAWFGYGFVGFAGMQKMSSSRGGVPTAADALHGDGGADPAVALRAPEAPADVQHRLRPRDGAAVRRVGRARPEGRRPGEARRRGAGLRAGVRDRDRRRAADAPGRRAVPDPVVGRRRDRWVRRADQPGDRARRPRARLGDRPRAAAVAGDGLDGGVRAAGGPDDRPGRARHRAAVVAVRARGAAGCLCCSTGSPRCRTTSTWRR